MDKEKMNARELTEKEMEQVSGGNPPPLTNCMLNCSYKNNISACPKHSNCPITVVISPEL